MNKQALITIIQYCLSEEACWHILKEIEGRFSFANNASVMVNKEWDESKHSRSSDGRFSSVGSIDPQDKPIAKAKTGDKDFDALHESLRVQVEGRRGAMRADDASKRKAFRKAKSKYDRLYKKYMQMDDEMDQLQERYADRESGSTTALKFPTEAHKKEYEKLAKKIEDAEKQMDNLEREYPGVNK